MFLKLALIFCITWNLASATSCTVNIHGHQNLDLERYEGTWNLIGFVEAEPYLGPVHDCVSESYARHSDNYHLLDTVWNGTINGDRVSQPGVIGIPSPFRWEASKWDFYMDGAHFETTIIATNYEDWAVEYACAFLRAEEGQPEGHFERVMIRSRSTSLSLPVLQATLAIVESYGFNVNNVKFINQTNC